MSNVRSLKTQQESSWLEDNSLEPDTAIYSFHFDMIAAVDKSIYPIYTENRRK